MAEADPDLIDVAAEFVASQAGGVERTLAHHRQRPDGYCAGCMTTLTHWPCAVAGIAMLARSKPAYRPEPKRSGQPAMERRPSQDA